MLSVACWAAHRLGLLQHARASSITAGPGQLDGSGPATRLWLPALLPAQEGACREAPHECDLLPTLPCSSSSRCFSAADACIAWSPPHTRPLQHFLQCGACGAGEEPAPARGCAAAAAVSDSSQV